LPIRYRVGGVAAGGSAAGGVRGLPANPAGFTVIPFAVLIAAVAEADCAGRRSVWRSRTAVWLGEISFAFYLIHQSVILDLMRGLGAQGSSPAVGGALAVFSLVLAVALAAGMHRFVEAPLVRRFSSRRGRHAHGDAGGVREHAGPPVTGHS
jgi:peptidoglycan/LPS O-acetylase OafA/YrhL